MQKVAAAVCSLSARVAALEMALADMALDLSALNANEPTNSEWRSYLSGDRAIFARRLADTIDEKAVDHITALYRDDQRFHNAADAYLGEFETLRIRRAKAMTPIILGAC